MDLIDFIIRTFCLGDDRLPEQGLRQRSFAPTLSDSEVITYFRRHHGSLFPAMRRIGRTSFARQAGSSRSGAGSSTGA